MTDIKIHRPHITNHNVQKPKKFEDSSKYIPEKVKDFAKANEKAFAKLMLKEMNKSVSKYSNDASADFYQGLLTDEQAQAMVEKNNGLGLQKLILDQIYPEHLRNQAQLDLQNRALMHKPNKIGMHDHPKRPEQAIKMYGQQSGESHE